MAKGTGSPGEAPGQELLCLQEAVWRLRGIAGNGASEFGIVVRGAPRSIAALSREHRDGWGIAVFDAGAGAWQIDRGIACAGEDERFHQLAVGSCGELLVSHVRQKTVGEQTLANTHPFSRGRWVFAHNGTIKALAWMRAHSSPERLAEVAGETDSEALFTWLLTRLDEVGVTAEAASERTDRALGEAAREARHRTEFGAFNFVLTDGATMYAHRFGRSMFLLERGPEDAVRLRRTSRDGTTIETPWSEDRKTVFIASEHRTDEPRRTVVSGG